MNHMRDSPPDNRILNSTHGGMWLSTLPLCHGGSLLYRIYTCLRVGGEEICLNLNFKEGDELTSPGATGIQPNHYTRTPTPV